MLIEALSKTTQSYGLIASFAIIGVIMWVSYWLSDKLTRGRLHGSAIAIFLGLLPAYAGGARWRHAA